ncbi:hypothetical protein [Streptomyces sp. NPDC091268]|uniref:hypothetical protein n=1 Tax=Streptomyces sp. NPDC091268 TaxID=3365979 RepID=UPI003804A054
MAAADYKFDVFIAFAPEDSMTQRDVRGRLLELGVRPESAYGETVLDFDPAQSELCRTFLLLATPNSAASPYVREHVEHWRKHRVMRESFHVLDVSGDTLRPAHRSARSWYHLLNHGPGDPLEERPAAIWPVSTLRDPFHAKSLASLLTGGRTSRPAQGVPSVGARPARATPPVPLHPTSRPRSPQPRSRIAAVVGVLLLALLLATAWAGTRSLLASHQSDGLGPTDAPAAVASIVSIGTVIGVLVGGILTGLAKLIQARGQRDADLVRANAEMVRAEADMIRARAGLPPTDSPTPGAPPPPAQAEPPAETPAP